jgi:hypothetical protein
VLTKQKINVINKIIIDIFMIKINREQAANCLMLSEKKNGG